jgi:hypothetical protein
MHLAPEASALSPELRERMGLDNKRWAIAHRLMR